MIQLGTIKQPHVLKPGTLVEKPPSFRITSHTAMNPTQSFGLAGADTVHFGKRRGRQSGLARIVFGPRHNMGFCKWLWYRATGSGSDKWMGYIKRLILSGM